MRRIILGFLFILVILFAFFAINEFLEITQFWPKIDDIFGTFYGKVVCK